MKPPMSIEEDSSLKLEFFVPALSDIKDGLCTSARSTLSRIMGAIGATLRTSLSRRMVLSHSSVADPLGHTHTNSSGSQQTGLPTLSRPFGGAARLCASLSLTGRQVPCFDVAAPMKRQ